mmetsp:Transcript_74649/g.205828  ORF Transcript_74649/g.205828 Transcript_74649/m.205828 type:complete len:212 (-) Transcript_74649:32-667(-)
MHVKNAFVRTTCTTSLTASVTEPGAHLPRGTHTRKLWMMVAWAASIRMLTPPPSTPVSTKSGMPKSMMYRMIHALLRHQTSRLAKELQQARLRALSRVSMDLSAPHRARKGSHTVIASNPSIKTATTWHCFWILSPISLNNHLCPSRNKRYAKHTRKDNQMNVTQAVTPRMTSEPWSLEVQNDLSRCCHMMPHDAAVPRAMAITYRGAAKV